MPECWITRAVSAITLGGGKGCFGADAEEIGKEGPAH